MIVKKANYYYFLKWIKKPKKRKKVPKKLKNGSKMEKKGKKEWITTFAIIHLYYLKSYVLYIISSSLPSQHTHQFLPIFLSILLRLQKVGRLL
jgi:hypothetical protein